MFKKQLIESISQKRFKADLYIFFKFFVILVNNFSNIYLFHGIGDKPTDSSSDGKSLPPLIENFDSKDRCVLPPFVFPFPGTGVR